MTEYDQDAVKAKYLAERDRRLVEGRTAIRDIPNDEHFASYTSFHLPRYARIHARIRCPTKGRASR